MSEQQEHTATLTAPGAKWGDAISEERQAKLLGYLDRWAAEREHGARLGPFDGDPDAPGVASMRLGGADVYWLAKKSGQYQTGEAPNLHLEGANLLDSNLDGVVLIGAHLERAYLDGASLIGAYLFYAQMKGAVLQSSSLQRAALSKADLEGANLETANLEGAHLDGTHLEGANLRGANLKGADLRGAWLDSRTVLADAILDSNTRFGDIQWSGVGAVNLTQVNWEPVPILGDERGVGLRAKASAHEGVVRAYRQVAAQLRAQGMNEVADRFLYRAQVRQRGVFLRQGKVGGYFFSLLVLSALAGYGFRLRRILFAYGLTLVLFAAGYFAAGQWLGGTHLEWYESLLVSLTAIHGRVFFTQFGLDNLQSWIAAVESVVGIVIEGVFVAMLIQRFFGR